MPHIQRETGTTLSEINMVPFIDVVLVLLIIFMITAPILQSGIDVDVPKTKTVKELTEVRMVVTIDRGQRVYLNDKPVNIHEIGTSTSMPDCRIGAVIMKIISSTSTTSINGTILISESEVPVWRSMDGMAVVYELYSVSTFDTNSAAKSFIRDATPRMP